MKKFQLFLAEAEEKSKAIKHLTHLAGESHFVSKEETNDELDNLHHLHKWLSGETSNVKSVGVKADGSPSFEMGHVMNHATGEKEFGVAYKGAAKGFAFTPKDIKEKFGHSPGLLTKMGQLLEHGKKVMSPIHGVVQGDFMGSKKDKTIQVSPEGASHKENLISYGYRRNHPEYDKLKKAKISVSVHTRIDKDKPEYNIDSDKLYDHPDVHIFNNKLSRKGLNYSTEDKNEYTKNFNKAKEHLNNILDHNSLITGHGEHLQTYINKTVREGTSPTAAGYKKHLSSRLQKAVDAVKRPETKLKKSIDKSNFENHVEQNKEDFTNLFKTHTHLDKAKNVLLRSLEGSEQNQSHTINNTPTQPEGFVVGYKSGAARKVVNRSKEGFSGLNLNK